MDEEWEKLEEKASELGCKDTIRLFREIGATFNKLIEQKQELDKIHLKRLELMTELKKQTGEEK
jgi:hypothetical protein